MLNALPVTQQSVKTMKGKNLNEAF